MEKHVPNKQTKNFEDFLKEKDNPVVYCTLKLEGDDFLETSHFTLDLKQIAGDHDQFTISVLDDALDTFEGEIMENSKNLLGKPLNIHLHRFGQVKFTFEGIITGIKNRKENGYGNLLIEGHSPTILLENEDDCQSYENQTLKQIIENATSEYQGLVKVYAEEVHLNLKNRGLVFPYVVQYKESDFQFLKRIAKRYGEWLFYDGANIVIGAKPYEKIELQENVDLIEVELSLNTKAQNYKFIAYDQVNGENKEKKSQSVSNQTRANHLQVVALNASNSMYKKEPELLYNQEALEVGKMLDVVTWRKNESKKNVMTIKGSSRNPEVAAGRDIKLIDINDRPMETYRVMNVRHFHNGAGEYYNEFEAVPYDTWIPPYFNENAIPLCEEQSAIVMDNNDPEGMSRIRVQFPWQVSKGGQSPWLRVVTPYAGKGKGMHILPEIGEEVIVGFENGNAEKPFVIGSMFHGKGTSGQGGSGNYNKGFKTASGSSLNMNDQDGSIVISDPSGNTVTLKGDGNIEISAPDMIKFLAKNIEFEASEKVKIDGTNEINLGSKLISSIGTDSVKIESQSVIESNAPKISSASQNTEIKAEASIDVEGTAMTNVKGGSVNLN